jgi:SAM-dependent methyltransferase
LDLGCGSAKLLKYIKKYHFLNYTGVDNDRLQMIYAENRIDKDYYFTDKSKVILSNLNNDWNILKNQYYDIIVANFSLHYYYSDKFWINMKNIIKQNGIFIFNLVNNNAKDKWIDENNYLYLEENIVKYYFESVHFKEMEEKYIEKEEILKACQENNLELIEEFTPNGNNLDSKYTWFIIKFN